MKPLGKELTGEQWIKIFDEANENGLLYLLLTGGEVFLHPDFYDIYTHAYENGAVISINTNGTMITEKQIEFFKNRPPANINVTMYGTSDEMYTKLCSNPIGFTNLKKTLAMLAEAKIRVCLNCSMTTENKDQLPEFLAFAAEQNLELNVAAYMFPPLRKSPGCAPTKNVRLDPEQCGEVFAYLNTTRDPDMVKKAIEAFDALEPIENDIVCPDTQHKCMAGKNNFWITWNGKMKPCGMFPVEFSMENGFMDAWHKVTEYSDGIRLPAKCETCVKKAFCKSCAAVNHAETGAYNQVPDFMCRLSDAYIERSRKILY